jgi:hypothetical protein
MKNRRLIVRNRKLLAREPPQEEQSRIHDPKPPSVIVVQGNEASVSRKPRKGGSMGARSKLNWAAVNGAILVAALVAGVTHSLWAGGVILVLLIVEAIATGQIRLSRRK